MGHVPALAGAGRSWPRCCSSRCWATCVRTRCRSCPRCASTPATGPRRCGRSRRAPRRSSTGSPGRPRNQVDQFVAFGYEPQVGGGHHAADDRVAHHAQPGPRPVLAAADPPARHRHPHRARGRVRVQLADRVQLRRRSPAQRGPDRRRADARRPSSRASASWPGWSRSRSQRRPAIQADRRGARGHRARHLEGRRRGRRAAVAAQRADPDCS